MDFQSLVDYMVGMGSVYSFEIKPDGSFGEILLMAVNKKNAAILSRNPERPKFYPGIPWRTYFTDLNFEAFCYKCGSTGEPLYSYVNAHGYWLKGFYLPLYPEGQPLQPIPPDQPRTAYVLYVVTNSKEVNSDAMSRRSAETSAAFINISIKLHETQDFNKAMTETVGELRKVCGSDLCSLITVDKNAQKCSFINEYGVQTEMLANIAKSMGRTPYEVALAWEKDLDRSDCLMLEELDVLKERDPDWYRLLVEFKINRLVLYAVCYNQNLVGFIWAANFDKSKILHIKETLELTTFLIGAAVANHQLMSQLRIRSETDELTQVGSRNLMNERVDAILAGNESLPETMGVAFADLNGLKTVNDTEGHAAGDKLLMRAATLLKLAYGDQEIYRAGGDEFVIFCPGVTEEELERMTAQLRALAGTTEDVSFAIGTVWLSGEYDICRAMQTADSRMYSDKERYYRENPDKDRRKKR